MVVNDYFLSLRREFPQTGPTVFFRMALHLTDILPFMSARHCPESIRPMSVVRDSILDNMSIVFTCVSYAEARNYYRLDVRPSVRLSVTRWHPIKTAEYIVMLSSPHDSPFILVL